MDGTAEATQAERVTCRGRDLIGGVSPHCMARCVSPVLDAKTPTELHKRERMEEKEVRRGKRNGSSNGLSLVGKQENTCASHLYCSGQLASGQALLSMPTHRSERMTVWIGMWDKASSPYPLTDNVRALVGQVCARNTSFFPKVHLVRTMVHPSASTHTTSPPRGLGSGAKGH